ncbi:K(+)-transporting ATPase subunit F [soil metagenome]
MWIKVIVGLVVILVLFLAYVSTRESKFHYERSGTINASADKIFPYLSNFKLGGEWSPYEKKDVNMKRSFGGADGVVGSTMEFDGNNDVGAGKLEMLKIVPNELVQIQLTMTKPFYGQNLVEYKLAPDGAGTKFTWAMSGDGGFMTKLITLFIDCDKMVAGDFEVGIANLKSVVEGKP